MIIKVNDNGVIKQAVIPTKTSDLQNDSGYITSASAPVTSVNGEVGDVNITKANLGLGNVENKSSETIRSELTKSNVTTALGFTPLDEVDGETLADQISSLNSSFQIKTSGSINDITKSGIYYCTAVVTDKPISSGGVLFVGAFSDAAMSGIYVSYSTAGNVAFGKRDSSGWVWVRSPNFTSITISETTSSTGAISIPGEYHGSIFIGAQMASRPGFVFRRDDNYFTVMDNNLSAIANTQVTFNAYFIVQ